MNCLLSYITEYKPNVANIFTLRTAGHYFQHYFIKLSKYTPFPIVNSQFLFLCLCILTVTYALFCIFCFHRANWHSPATLTEVFPCFFLSCKANARVKLAKMGHAPGKDPVPIVQEAGWAPGPVWTCGKSRPTAIRSPDRPARSQSLYRLSYPAHVLL